MDKRVAKTKIDLGEGWTAESIEHVVRMELPIGISKIYDCLTKTIFMSGRMWTHIHSYKLFNNREGKYL